MSAADKAGRLAYVEDVRRMPLYPHNGRERPSWDDLGDVARESWRRNPTPRQWDSAPIAA